MASTTTRSPDDVPEGVAPARETDAPEHEEAPTDAREVLVVELPGAAYALDAARARDGARAAPVTPLAGTARWVLGLAAVRGALVPVADVRRRASHGRDADDAPSDARDAWMVVVDDGRRGAALVGWRVRGVASARQVGDADAQEAARDARGLPVRGAVRLTDDARRTAGA
ncbi:chemotaxis protein CheW, partial [Roseisolibacter sp. H3M3-2]|uniref:chemotaxis protein CheW n=1 Tax=Roseisolibacter sp. H3M3-2 TaxID=3031323 RepID=UPI0023DC096F